MLGWVVEQGPCPYLPGRSFTAFVPGPGWAGEYRALMDLRFRRTGAMAYAPICRGCRACVPIRVDVARFAPRRDQRRVAARNADLRIAVAARGADGERTELWRRYQLAVHGDQTAGDPSGMMLDDGGVPGGELHARDADGRLLAVSIIDVAGDALSSVYCYYDPDARSRGLGTFMALAELAHAAALGCRWWYLGFWVDGCARMAYKRRFGPHQLLGPSGWHDAAPSG